MKYDKTAIAFEGLLEESIASHPDDDVFEVVSANPRLPSKQIRVSFELDEVMADEMSMYHVVVFDEDKQLIDIEVLMNKNGHIVSGTRGKARRQHIHEVLGRPTTHQSLKMGAVLVCAALLVVLAVSRG